ncbi:MAG: hypothetical protein F4X63_09260 [Nitrospira sp. SB0662_bin_26]|nr:hypothetical protein [Nitrospira sp. SB0662_bin_26]
MVQGIELNYNAEENPKIRAQIRSFRDLDHGWHYGEGRGATELAIEAALTIHSYFIKYGIREIEVFPDLDGGILVSGYHEKHTLEVFCNQDGHTDIIHETNDEVVHKKKDVMIDEIVEYLGGLSWRLKKLFDSFIANTIVRKSSDLRAWHSRIPQEIEEYQLSTRNVQKRVAGLNVNTYAVSISQNPQETLLSFGESLPPIYPKKPYLNTNRRILATSAT